MLKIISLWLAPDKENSEYLSEVIESLSEKYDAPSFYPHLTLYGSAEIPEEKELEIIEKLKSIASELDPFEIQMEKVNYSELFFKTLFIEVKMNENLQNIFSKIETILKPYGQYTFLPHISLLYKEMPIEEKKKEEGALHLKDSYIISEMKIVTPGNVEKGWHDIKSWQIVSTFAL